MQERFELAGSCWQPKEPDEKSTATLSFDPSSGTYLTNVAGPIGGVGQQFDLIHWQSHLGERFSCVGCHGVERRGVPPESTSKIWVRWLYKGIHLDSPNAARFTQVRYFYSNLHRWLCQVPKAQLMSAHGNQATVEIRTDPLWECSVQDGFRLRNYATAKIQSDPDTFHLHFISEEGIEVVAPEPVELSKFHKIERRFRSLVDVFADGRLQLSDIHAQIGGDWIEISVQRGTVEPIEIVFMPVRFIEVKNRLAEVITKWMALPNGVNSAVNLYLLASHSCGAPSYSRERESDVDTLLCGASSVGHERI